MCSGRECTSWRVCCDLRSCLLWYSSVYVSNAGFAISCYSDLYPKAAGAPVRVTHFSHTQPARPGWSLSMKYNRWNKTSSHVGLSQDPDPGQSLSSYLLPPSPCGSEGGLSLSHALVSLVLFHQSACVHNSECEFLSSSSSLDWLPTSVVRDAPLNVLHPPLKLRNERLSFFGVMLGKDSCNRAIPLSSSLWFYHFTSLQTP